MLSPKRVKFRKVQKGRSNGLAYRGGYNDIARFQMTGDVIVTKTNGQGR